MNYQPGLKLEDIEKETIIAAFNFFHRNKTHTANALGISVKTLYNKLSEYGIHVGDKDADSYASNNVTRKGPRERRDSRADNFDASSEPQRTQQGLGRFESKQIDGNSITQASVKASARNGMEHDKDSKEQILPMQQRQEVQKLPHEINAQAVTSERKSGS